MANKITDEGFVKERYQDLREETAQNFQSKFGNDIKTDRSSVFGQLISISTQSEDEIASLIQSLLSAFDPRQASDVLLSRLAAVMGTNRKEGVKSSVTLDVVTNKTVLLRDGFTVKNQDGIEFSLKQDTNLPAGTNQVTLLSRDFGAFNSAPNTVTLIATPVFGVTSVTNTLSAILGNGRETDAQLRQRLVNGAFSANQTITGVTSAISQIQGIESFHVRENNEDFVTPDGQDAHSLFIVIDGGSDADIARVLIDDAVAARIGYSAPTVVTLIDGTFEDPITGQVYTASWARPVAMDMFVSITVTILPGYTSDDAVKIRNAISNYVIGLKQVGGKIQANDLICPALHSTDKIDVDSILIGNISPGLDSLIDLGFVGKANITSSNVVITISNS